MEDDLDMNLESESDTLVNPWESREQLGETCTISLKFFIQDPL